MSARCALVKALLEGRVINIKNCFKDIGYTNAPREISRFIEKTFGVEVSRTPRKGKNRYGEEVSWYDYRLNRSEHNLEGILKMEQYLEGQAPSQENKPTPQLNKLF